MIFFSIEKECGQSNNANDLISLTTTSSLRINKIVNGKTAVANSLPSIALIYIDFPDGLIGNCDGTLIDAQTVLSAAQ